MANKTEKPYTIPITFTSELTNIKSYGFMVPQQDRNYVLGRQEVRNQGWSQSKEGFVSAPQVLINAQGIESRLDLLEAYFEGVGEAWIQNNFGVPNYNYTPERHYSQLMEARKLASSFLLNTFRTRRSLSENPPWQFDISQIEVLPEDDLALSSLMIRAGYDIAEEHGFKAFPWKLQEKFKDLNSAYPQEQAAKGYALGINDSLLMTKKNQLQSNYQRTLYRGQICRTAQFVSNYLDILLNYGKISTDLKR